MQQVCRGLGCDQLLQALNQFVYLAILLQQRSKIDACVAEQAQVQLAIGLMLIAGSVLGALFSPVWFLLTGLIGAGLAIAGLTGFCGLALFMAKMPWNQR